MQIYGALEGTRGCNQLLFFFFFFFFFLLLFFFFFMSLPGRQIYIFLTLIFFIFSPFPGHQMFIFWPVENCTTWNLRYLMLRDAGWALRHWRSCYLYFCCFWINVTQINVKNIKRKIQRIISDSCFQLKSWFNVNARAPSIPLLNFPFKGSMTRLQALQISMKFLLQMASDMRGIFWNLENSMPSS